MVLVFPSLSFLSSPFTSLLTFFRELSDFTWLDSFPFHARLFVDWKSWGHPLSYRALELLAYLDGF